MLYLTTCLQCLKQGQNLVSTLNYLEKAYYKQMLQSLISIGQQITPLLNYIYRHVMYLAYFIACCWWANAHDA